MSKELEALEVIGFYPIDYDGKNTLELKMSLVKNLILLKKDSKPLKL